MGVQVRTLDGLRGRTIARATRLDDATVGLVLDGADFAILEATGGHLEGDFRLVVADEADHNQLLTLRLIGKAEWGRRVDAKQRQAALRGVAERRARYESLRAEFEGGA